jgi:hypothetical protein
MVFCRETGANEDEDDVDALEGVGSIIATDMLPALEDGRFCCPGRPPLLNVQRFVTPGRGRTKN